MKKPDEPQILHLLAQGSEYAFAQVFDRYQGRVFNAAYSLLKSREFAKDVVQEVFLKVWNRRVGFTNVRNLEAYIYEMARHQTLKALRKRSAEIAALCRFALTQDVSENNVDTLMRETDYAVMVQQVVNKLPEQQKQVFQLSRMEGLSHKDIAERLQISGRTVNNHINAALKFIRKHMELGAGTVVFPLFLCVFDR